MVNGINRVNALSPVELQKLAEKRKTRGSQFSELVREMAVTWCKTPHGFSARERVPSGHILVVRGANQLEDDLGLV